MYTYTICRDSVTALLEINLVLLFLFLTVQCHYDSVLSHKSILVKPDAHPYYAVLTPIGPIDFHLNQ